MWMSCVPDPLLAGYDSGLPYGFTVNGYKNPQNPFLHRREPGKYDITVPFGAKVTYEDLVITVTKGDKSLYHFTDINSLKVIDDLMGNRTFYGSSDEDQFGYGFLTIDNDWAAYENYKIPPEIKPTPEENLYIINTAMYLTPFLINSTYKTFVEPATKVPLPIIAGKLNRYKPMCQETAEITMGIPSMKCKAPKYPTFRSFAKTLAEASYLRRNSRNPFVLTIARDAIDILHESTGIDLKKTGLN
jgi:hypothetical protein